MGPKRQVKPGPAFTTWAHGADLHDADLVLGYPAQGFLRCTYP
jgi:hypothetical protein